MIFPSVADLCDEIGLELLDGATIVVRGLPRSGRTKAVERVAELLGASALLVRGRAVDGEGYRKTLASIEADLRVRVEAHGRAQLLLDDFGILMRQTFGHAIQAALRALVVDGALAARVGTLLTASLSDPLTAPRRHGSPLVAHARVRFAPWLGEREYGLTGGTAEERRSRAELCGSNVALLDRSAAGVAGVRAFAELQLPRWLADLDQADLDRLVAAAERDVAYEPSDDRLAPLLSRSGDVVRLITAVPAMRLREARVGPWPSSIANAAERLTIRVGGEPSPLWVDRYVGAHPVELAALLTELATRVAPRELRLLGTPSGTRNAIANPVELRMAVASAAAAGLKVNWRLVDDRDFSLAHARQLVLQSTGTVYLLPPEDRVLGVSALGNEGDALATGADFTIAEGFWARSKGFTL